MSLEGRYLVPGLISVHTHLSVVYPFSATDENENPGLTVLRAYGRAQDALRAGITTIRCVQELKRADLLLAEAARAGWADVPRIVGAGRAIGIPGGHGDGHGSVIADGPEAFREAALAELDAGCSHIKVFITGGIANLGETFDHPEMSKAEMAATVGAASERNTYVVTHAASSLAINWALDAGIRSFEHAYDLDEETAGRMAAKGVFLAPTLCVTRSPIPTRARSMRSATTRESDGAPRRTTTALLHCSILPRPRSATRRWRSWSTSPPSSTNASSCARTPGAADDGGAAWESAGR